MSEILGGGSIQFVRSGQLKEGDQFDGTFESIALDQPGKFGPESYVRLGQPDGSLVQVPLKAGNIRAVRDNLHRFVPGKTVLHMRFDGKKTSKAGRQFGAWTVTADGLLAEGAKPAQEHPNVAAAKSVLGAEESPF